MALFIITTLSAIILGQPDKYKISLHEKQVLILLIVFDILSAFSYIPILNIIPFVLGIILILKRKMFISLRRQDRVIIDVIIAFFIIQFAWVSILLLSYIVILILFVIMQRTNLKLPINITYTSLKHKYISGLPSLKLSPNRKKK